MSIENLHSHTTSSDGKQTHDQVLATARQHGIGITAFTDHDTLMPISVVNRLRGEAVTNWISGIEISSVLPPELGSKPHSKFHIVGLFVDPTHTELKQHCQNAAENKINRSQKIIVALRELGFDITFKEVLGKSSGTAIGYPHMVEALLEKDINRLRLESIRRKMKSATRHDLETRKKYQRMMKSGPKQYPYTLLFSSSAFIPGIYQKSGFQKGLDENVNLIRNAGGVAILAHYYSVSDTISPDLLDTLIKAGRLDGIETVFGLFAFVDGNPNLFRREQKVTSEIVARHNCLQSGGADSHRQQDIIDFARLKSFSDRTTNMAETIVRQRKSSNWSSLQI
ncbi:MAG: PHP domain protein [Microgenomates group bacterium GW2011_GWA2_40_6]|nr:MAG: PHP domain protein [Microgenomates group bacterium GW2011_GWA2_40_6]